jgi:hypothetical protein
VSIVGHIPCLLFVDSSPFRAIGCGGPNEAEPSTGKFAAAIANLRVEAISSFPGATDLLIRWLEALGIWLLLMLLGTNVVGLLVRGLVSRNVASVPEDASARVTEVLGPLVRNARRANYVMTLLSITLCGLLLFCLYWYVGGLLAVAAACMVMFARIPGVLSEIRTGEKVARPRRPVDYLCDLLVWGALPIIWLAMRRNP